jgi:mRNA interferase RelE/StbE
MGYSIKISKSVQKQIVDLPNGMKGRILEKIKGIESPQQPHYLVARETLATHFQRFYLLCNPSGKGGGFSLFSIDHTRGEIAYLLPLPCIAKTPSRSLSGTSCR